MTARRRPIVLFESKRDPLISRGAFARRMAASFAVVAVLIAVSLVVGMIGYHTFEHMPWVDAFSNASMIMSGMGPLSPLQTTGGKIFAGAYALYSGLALILATGVLLGPLLHRLMHKFHLEEPRNKQGDQGDDNDDDDDDEEHSS